MGCASQCAKYFLCLFNFIFFVSISAYAEYTYICVTYKPEPVFYETRSRQFVNIASSIRDRGDSHSSSLSRARKINKFAKLHWTRLKTQ